LRARVNILLKIRTPDIRISRYHPDIRISSGYQGYHPDIRGMINGHQEKIDQIPKKKYLTGFARIFKNICWIYLIISQISVDGGERVKNLKNR